MKNYQKTILICVVMLFCAANHVFSQNRLEVKDLQISVNKFANRMSLSLPFNSTMGLNWSDAYIGSMPPHFGIGVTTGFTTMDFTSISELMERFGLRFNLKNTSTFQDRGLPVPGYTVEARIGGIVIPLDFGFKFGYLPPGLFDGLMGAFSDKQTFGFKNMLIGMDLRYAPLVKKVSPLRFSIGIGFNYMGGEITADLPDNLTFVFFNSKDNIYRENLISKTAGSQLGIEWRTLTFEVKAQASFSFKIITPYAGVGASYALSQAGYRVDSPVTNSDIVDELMKADVLTAVSDTGFEIIRKINSFNVRAFGGFSLNLAVFRLDLTGMYNILGGNLGATVGFRFQL